MVIHDSLDMIGMKLNKNILIISVAFILFFIFIQKIHYRNSLDGKITKALSDLHYSNSSEKMRTIMVIFNNGGEINNPGADDRTPTGPPVIETYEAWMHVGEVKTIIGGIRYIENNKKDLCIGFRNPHQGDLAILIKKEGWTNFPMSPEKMYKLGQKIQATGKIVWYQGDPVIYVSYPSEIVVN